MIVVAFVVTFYISMHWIYMQLGEGKSCLKVAYHDHAYDFFAYVCSFVERNLLNISVFLKIDALGMGNRYLAMF